MDLHLETQIKNARLTKTERMIANYFLENKESLYFMTARDISLALNTSDTSVIRLCRTLGYSGFRELQAKLQGELAQLLEKERYTIPQAKLPEQHQKYRNLNAYEYLNMTMQHLQNTYAKNDPGKYQQAAELILQSGQVFVAGFRGFAAAAVYLGVLLSQYTAHIQYTGQADSSCIERMLDYGSEDCVILIGGERYSKMAQILADMAREVGCRLIVITDKITSPLAYNADVVFLADTEGPSAMHSYLGTYFLVEALHFELSRLLGVAAQPRLNRLNQYLSEIELY